MLIERSRYDTSKSRVQIVAVLNPHSRSGRVAGVGKALQDAASQLEVDLVVRETSTPSEIRSVIWEFRDKPVTYLVAGGDGSIHQMVNVLQEMNPTSPLAIYPCGTGNDFATSLGIKQDAVAVMGWIVNNQFVEVDIGRAKVDGKKIFFCNALGVGFDALSARKAITLKRWLGVAAYRLAVPLSYLSWKKTEFVVALDDEVRVRDQELLFVSVSNGPASGGGIVIAPGAELNDGLFDVVIVKHAGLFRVLRILPAAIQGKHVVEPEVTIVRARKVLISSDRNVSVHADGEIVSSGASSVAIAMKPRQMKIFAPSST